ncbi:MAG: hypothetical protein EOP06_08930 [Proteobacteria bacterium]|nr:MAG: hypothetical protein EOP06_08930 [Pseudomonadota bacterium]
MSILFVLSIIVLRIYFVHSGTNEKSLEYETALNNGDAGHYLKIGMNLAHYGVYSDDQSSAPTEMAAWRAPVWPMLLALFFKFTSNLFVILLCKTIIEIAIVLFVLFRIKKYFTLNWLYLLPFLLLLLEPHYIKYSMTFLTESFTAVLLLLLSTLFVTMNTNRSGHIAIPVLGAVIILCHPVSIFCVLVIVGLYLLMLIKQDWKRAGIHAAVFCAIAISWPIRNDLTYKQGIFLTASQGTTFSKGWNEDVLQKFTNTRGDLADESHNLKYLTAAERNAKLDVIASGKRMKKATMAYLKTIDLSTMFQIAATKLKSNFNPFPEIKKPGLLEMAGTFFRCLFLVNFVLLAYRFVKKGKLRFSIPKDRVYLIVFAILAGQVLMSIYIYTGLRFNSIYGLTSFFCFILLVFGRFLTSGNGNKIM